MKITTQILIILSLCTIILSLKEPTTSSLNENNKNKLKDAPATGDSQVQVAKDVKNEKIEKKKGEPEETKVGKKKNHKIKKPISRQGENGAEPVVKEGVKNVTNASESNNTTNTTSTTTKKNTGFFGWFWDIWDFFFGKKETTDDASKNTNSTKVDNSTNTTTTTTPKTETPEKPTQNQEPAKPATEIQIGVHPDNGPGPVPAPAPPTESKQETTEGNRKEPTSEKKEKVIIQKADLKKQPPTNNTKLLDNPKDSKFLN